MITKRIKKDKDMSKQFKKKKNVFNLAEVILIMVITSICVITITIKVSFSVNKTSQKIKTEAELSELIDIYNSINNDYYEEIDKKQLITAAIDGMLDVLDDPYTVYMDETETDNFNKELDGEYVGLGAEIASYSDGNYIINKVYDNSPASKAGLKQNDKLLKINGENISGVKIGELSSKLKVKEGTKITITVKRDEKELNLDTLIGKVEIQSVSYELIKTNNKNIAYVKITTFAKNTFEQFKKVSNNFEQDKIDGIVIDLRNNTGGHLTIAQSILELFLNKGDVLYKLSNKNGIKSVKSTKEKIINQNVVLLVNEQTASASEILTAALKENLNSDVVGVKTYGKGKVQKIQKLSNGSTVKYTIQNWLTPKGDAIDKNGIQPTIEIKLDEVYKNNPVKENDNQYKKAIEIASQK